jgi:hypothetical protein
VDPIFNDLIKLAMENAAFWENVQTLEQSASTIEGNYKAFKSAASKFNNNFTYQYPIQYHAETPPFKIHKDTQGTQGYKPVLVECPCTRNFHRNF